MRLPLNKELYLHTEGIVELIMEEKIAVPWTFAENGQRQTDEKKIFGVLQSRKIRVEVKMVLRSKKSGFSPLHRFPHPYSCEKIHDLIKPARARLVTKAHTKRSLGVTKTHNQKFTRLTPQHSNP